MSAKIRNLLLTAVAVLLLPLIFTAIQGLLARYIVPSILTVPHIVSKTAATVSVVYAYGVLGSALSAMLLIVPLGLWLTWRPWLFGTIVGMLAVVELAAVFQRNDLSNYVEYASLIVFSILAAEIGSSIQRARRMK